VQRRDQAEDESGHDRHRQREEQDGSIQPDDRLRGNDARRNHGDEGLEPAPGHERAEGGASQGQNEAFDQELAHEPPAARAQGGPDGELLLARGGPGEEEIGHVAAADEQEQADGGQDDEEGDPETSHDHVGQRLDLHLEVLGVVLRVDGRQPVAHDLQIRFRLGDRDPGPEMAEQEPIAPERRPFRCFRPAGLFGYPEVGIAPGEAGRHDADQRA